MSQSDNLPISNGHITLRRLRIDDLHAFLAYRADPEVARFQSWGEADENSARGLINAMSMADIPKPGAWSQIAVAGADDALLGDMGLYLSEDSTEAEVGITLSRAAQGNGTASLAVEAALTFLFQTPALARIIAIADKRNTAAIKCMQASGFQFTHEADYEEVDGTITPEVHYQIRRP